MDIPTSLPNCDYNDGQFPCVITSTYAYWVPYIHFAETLIGLVIVLILLILIAGPYYQVWDAHKRGQADLAQAQNESQIQIAEANGRLLAAEANKQAAIIEAEAVAEQVTIIGNNIANHQLYLTWQWIKMMEERDGQTIYVPTEANLPILEASRKLG